MPANDQFRYNLKKMHVIFAVSCLAIFLATLLMMVKDHADDWRPYQRTNFALQAAVQKRDRDRLQSGDYEARRKEIQDRIDAAKLEVEADRPKLVELEELQKDQLFKADVLAKALKLGNAERDASNARRDIKISRGGEGEDLDPFTAAYVGFKNDRDVIELELQDVQEALDGTKNKIKAITKSRDAATADLAKLNADIDRINKTVSLIAPSGLAKAKRWLMEQPIIDGFNSHMKVKQDWTPNLKLQLGMAKIARFDRCRTCHMNADVTAAGNVAAFPAGHPSTDDVNDWVKENKFPQPFSTHPSHELYVSSSSPHPVAKFGCTICHDGQGSATSFGDAEHTPNNPEQFDEWHEEYGFHPNHFWELPMQPKRFIESGCIKCHHQVTELGINPKYGASAPKVYRGYETIKKFGCFGCHEMHGFDGSTAIGPDLRLEPNFGSVAAQMMTMMGDAAGAEVDRARELLATVHGDPLAAEGPRNELKNMLMADRQAEEPVFPRGVSGLASALKDTDGVAGKMRKVGPSFRRLKSKTTLGFVESWTEEPKAFRPTTRMPQFYGLTNQQDAHAKLYESVELAGIAQYLFDKSVPLDELHPADGYEPDVERGKRLFAERGCLACHNHKEFPESSADFAPELSRVYEKVRRDEDNPEFSSWLYTWVKDPERYHERTRMPNLYLDVYKEGGVDVDPAADISAWLLSPGGPGDFPALEVDDKDLDVVVSELLAKAINKGKVDGVLTSMKYPVKSGSIKGDEVELATADGSAVGDSVEWRRRKLNYVGRKTISKYGCYGCHDVPGFETARPIGAALQDWGRKDTSKLALEHIEEWLHHHGEADGSSTHDRVEAAVAKEDSGDYTDEDARRKDMSTSYFYQSLGSHGRAGFIWQKLRQPRSYDYEKITTKGYDERLRMPKFPFDEDDIEAVAAFVLGMVADPPAAEYIYKPSVQENDRIEGEQLLAKYNCTGCHLLDMPEITFGADNARLEELVNDAKSLEQYLETGHLAADDVHAEGLKLLLEMKPPRVPFTGRQYTVNVDDTPTVFDQVTFKGLVRSLPDMDEDIEDQLWAFDLWETLQVNDEEYLLPKYNLTVPVQRLEGIKPSRGGAYAEWLARHMISDDTGIGGSGQRSPDLQRARQMSPPPLYLEGFKVQTPWLYEFLLEPYTLRHETVLRMPRFNMSKAEAQTLANYFAARDGVPYPYQDLEPRDPDYLNQKTKDLIAAGHMNAGDDYLDTSWQVLTGKGLPSKAQLCSKCHAVGGEAYVGGGEKDVRGPNLQYASTRLRPDWLRLWLYNPGWVTPYTGMPVNFGKKGGMEGPFGGHPSSQATGVRDALMNYYRIMEVNRGAEVATKPEPAPEPTGDAAE